MSKISSISLYDSHFMERTGTVLSHYFMELNRFEYVCYHPAFCYSQYIIEEQGGTGNCFHNSGREGNNQFG